MSPAGRPSAGMCCALKGEAQEAGKMLLLDITYELLVFKSRYAVEFNHGKVIV